MACAVRPSYVLIPTIIYYFSLLKIFYQYFSYFNFFVFVLRPSFGQTFFGFFFFISVLMNMYSHEAIFIKHLREKLWL